MQCMPSQVSVIPYMPCQYPACGNAPLNFPIYSNIGLQLSLQQSSPKIVEGSNAIWLIWYEGRWKLFVCKRHHKAALSRKYHKSQRLLWKATYPKYRIGRRDSNTYWAGCECGMSEGVVGLCSANCSTSHPKWLFLRTLDAVHAFHRGLSFYLTKHRHIPSENSDNLLSL